MQTKAVRSLDGHAATLTERGGYEQEQKRQEKENAWLAKLADIERLRDALGFPIDEKIRETVVALNLIGIPTSASCEGHIDRAKGAPWVKVEAPNKPHERFIGEDGIIEMIAERYHVSPEDVRTSKNYDAWREATNLAAAHGETPEYQEWRRESDALRERLTAMIKEFYRDRVVDETMQIEIIRDPEGSTRIHNGGDDFRRSSRGLTDDERRLLVDRLAKYQVEMKAFTDFLKEKYYSSQQEEAAV